VQRFGSELRGFENVCAHRKHPLRTKARGNGPMFCGFHQWQYDRDGRALGIPVCNLLFGKAPHELGAHLRRIDIATCGTLIFGRFPSERAMQSLEEYLGNAFPVLEAATQLSRQPMFMQRQIRANWKLNMHVTLDEYHGPAVHPKTFGQGGYTPDAIHHRYFRLGANSAFCFSDDKDCLDKLVAGCRNSTYRSSHYFVFQILPDLIVAHAEADKTFYYCNILQYSPVTHDTTAFRAWAYPAPFASDTSWLARAIRPITDTVRNPIYFHFFKRIVNEDATVAERIQEVAHQIDTVPMLGAREMRVAWFEESIRDLAGLEA
jgi:phenylpropionate dioxygenase-like ring-hydroxylating dioxygenase large terminal subunit